MSDPSERSLQAEVLHDYYESFRFSQGSAPVQRLWMSLVADEYHTTWPPERLAELKTELPALGMAALGLYEPRGHAPLTINRKLEFANQWQSFTRHVTGRPFAVWPYQLRLRGAGHCLIDRDLKYLNLPYGRYTSRSDNDHHYSMYRDHVLGDQDSGSETFNTLFGKLRARSLEYGLPADTGFLRAAWEEGHPGQAFFPAVYAAEMAAAGRQQSRRHRAAYGVAKLLRR